MQCADQAYASLHPCGSRGFISRKGAVSLFCSCWQCKLIYVAKRTIGSDVIAIFYSLTTKACPMMVLDNVRQLDSYLLVVCLFLLALYHHPCGEKQFFYMEANEPDEYFVRFILFESERRSGNVCQHTKTWSQTTRANQFQVKRN